MDLNNSQNWTNVYSGRLGGAAPLRPNNRIPALLINCNSPVLRVKIDSRYTLDSWQLGAWANFFCSINGTYTKIPSSVFCALKNWSLLEFAAPSKLLPYKLELSFPRWLYEIDIEIQEYQEPSGIYISSELAGLQQVIQGEEFILVNPEYLPVSGNPSLILSRFIVDLIWEKFEIARLKSIDSGQLIPEPSISIAPYKVQFDFISNAQIRDRSIVVNIKPRTNYG